MSEPIDGARGLAECAEAIGGVGLARTNKHFVFSTNYFVVSKKYLFLTRPQPEGWPD